MKDYYSTMEISRNATQEEIKSAYKKLAKKYHPDANRDEDTTTKFIEMKEAYDILSKEDKRKEYDEALYLYENPPKDIEQENINDLTKDYTEQKAYRFTSYVQPPGFIFEGIKSFLYISKNHGLKFALSLYGKINLFARGLSTLLMLIANVILINQGIINIEMGLILGLSSFVFIWFVASIRFFTDWLSKILDEYGYYILMGALAYWLLKNL